MLNKIRLKNEGAEFEAYFDGEAIKVPSGTFDVNLTLGNFIIGLSKKWNVKISKIESDQNLKIERIEDKIESVKTPVVKEDVEEVEEVKEEITSKKKK